MKFHPDALTGEQLEILVASAPLSQKWSAYLAGGSALALQLGHRRSVDLDWSSGIGTSSSLAPSTSKAAR